MKAPVSLPMVVGMLVCAGCSETFSPDGPYQERLVVYGILTTASDTQYVQVRTTYRNPGGPAGVFVTEALVTVQQGDSVYAFRDTTILPADSTRGRVGAYVAYRLHVQPGLVYTLSVTSPSLGRVSSQATGLYRGTLLPYTDPLQGIGARVYPGVIARAYIVRLYLEYEVREDTTWVPGLAEVPLSVDPNGNFSYPRPLSREVSAVAFDASAYAAVVSQLRQRYGIVRLRGTRYVLTELDNSLYAYYSTANGFPDTGTLRLDEPDYTNIIGGLGVFAATSVTVVEADSAGHGQSR